MKQLYRRSIILLLIITISIPVTFSEDINLNEINFDKYDTYADWHIITGYTALGLGIAAGILNPKIVDEDIHCAVGYLASGMSAISLGLGAAAYSSLGAGVSEGLKDVHVVTGIIGASLMVASSVIVELGGHEQIGALGTLLMGVSIMFEIDL